MKMPMNFFSVHWLVPVLAPFGTARAGRKAESHRKKLNPFFFFGIDGWPQTDLLISRIAREISKSFCMSEVAVFCIRRTAA